MRIEKPYTLIEGMVKSAIAGIYCGALSDGRLDPFLENEDLETGVWLAGAYIASDVMRGLLYLSKYLPKKRGGIEEKLEESDL